MCFSVRVDKLGRFAWDLYPYMATLIYTLTHSLTHSYTDVSQYEHDPLADAVYIRANFTYIPRNPRELSIKSGDVFHIHDEAPSERFRSSFWVSRLSADGTDEQIGAIPNSMKAQEYLEAQGECKLLAKDCAIQLQL